MPDISRGAKDFRNSDLWRRTLEPVDGDPYADERAHLKQSFVAFHDRAAVLAGEISSALPSLTVHDVSHLDSLWAMASVVAGPEFPVTPLEAFVLGGAFLVHDLGLGLAAFPRGVEELKKDVRWTDTLIALCQSSLGRRPTEEELLHPQRELEEEATATVLRQLHAERAEHLGFTTWTNGANQYHLIEDADLRVVLGPLIGKLGHSHWWPTNQLADKFGRLGSPHGYPGDWTIDGLKLACLLRVADAADVHAGRAPGFLHALRQPQGIAKRHWDFQAKILQPIPDGDRLVYTASSAFEADEAEAWWLCFETLSTIDAELADTNALLQDTGRPKLRANSVAGAGAPRRLARYVTVDGWIPVDARISVGDVASLVLKLGGQALYGNDLLVPIRELIQNASDAIRARRILEKRAVEWGDVTVRLEPPADGRAWLVVEDNGIGMSPELLSGPFLDFGTSYWSTPLMQEELPGLLSAGFYSTGKYGIGFFSVFMLGDEVQVISRRSGSARSATSVLHFPNGVRSRPILRSPATEDEFLEDGGTRVRVKLRHSPYTPDGLLGGDYDRPVELPEALGSICPSLDCNLHIKHLFDPVATLVHASDWTTMDGTALVRRVLGESRCDPWPELVPLLGQNLRLLQQDGEVVGRAALAPAGLADSLGYFENVESALTCGGLRSAGVSGTVGVFVGTPLRASRDVAVPIVRIEELARWASEQAPLAAEKLEVDEEFASTVWLCGGETMPLPLTGAGGLNAAQVTEWAKEKDVVHICTQSYLNLTEKYGLKLLDNVIAVGPRGISLISSDSRMYSLDDRWPPSRFSHCPIEWRYYLDGLSGDAIHAVGVAWGSPLAQLLDGAERHRERFVVGELNGEPWLERGVITLHRPGSASGCSPDG